MSSNPMESDKHVDIVHIESKSYLEIPCSFVRAQFCPISFMIT